MGCVVVYVKKWILCTCFQYAMALDLNYWLVFSTDFCAVALRMPVFSSSVVRVRYGCCCTI